MAELIERREYTPKRFYAGEFPAVPETGTAGRSEERRVGKECGS